VFAGAADESSCPFLRRISMKARLVGCAAVAISLALCGIARAGDDPWVSLDDAVKKRGTGPPLVVVVGKEDGDLAKVVRTLVSDSRVAKLIQPGVVIARIDPAVEESAKKLGMVTEEKECLVVQDGYGLLVARNDKTPTADSLATLLKQAETVTAKKKKLEKTLDGALVRGEAALKKDDTKTACETFLAMKEYETSVPCSAMTKAMKHLEELAAAGQALLGQARTAIEKQEFPKAGKLVKEVEAGYPIRSVLDEAKKVQNELAEAIDAQR
jgi:hypothetical protein